jgi:tetratricopeptide (TPR) repeat protein
MKVSMKKLLTPFVFLFALAANAQLPAGTTDAAQAIAPDANSAVRTHADEALQKGDYREAIKLLLVLTDRGPNDRQDPQLLYNLAYAQDALDQVSNAESNYRRAIVADPNMLEARVALGLLLARAGRADEAHAELLAAVKLPSGDAPLKARTLRALARLDLKSDPDNAREELLAALKLTPETPDDTLMAAELADRAKDPAAAEKEYRRVLANTPNDPDATSALAGIVAKTNSAEAVTLLTDALTANPGNPALSSQLAVLYANQGKFDQAIPLVEPLHAAHHGDLNIDLLLAHLYSQSGAFAQADPLYATILDARPSARLRDDRASNLIKLRRYAEAETLLKQAVAKPDAFPTNEDYGLAAAHLAFAASNNNDPQEVLRALALRATVLPQSPSSLFLAATAHDKLHEVKQAVDLYNQFLAAAKGKFPDEEFEARHRLVTLAHMK